MFILMYEKSWYFTMVLIIYRYNLAGMKINFLSNCHLKLLAYKSVSTWPGNLDFFNLNKYCSCNKCHHLGGFVG